MKLGTMMLVGVAGLLMLVDPGSVAAQDEGTKVPVRQNQVLSTNPFLLLGEWANLEYERKVSPTTTMGIGGSLVSFDDGDDRYQSLVGLVRHYPQGAPLTGFYFGGRLGVHAVSSDDDDGHAYGLGVDVGYSWLLGAERNFYIGLGIGATRLFGGDMPDARVVIPSIRLLNVGFSF
jgi:hypothetical protein